LVAEAAAMRNGIKAAVHNGFQNIHVEGDNKTLIQALTDQIDVPWPIHTLVQDIKLYLQQCNNIIITHIFREGNFAADWVAKQGLSIQSIVVWNEVPHRDLMLILGADNL